MKHKSQLIWVISVDGKWVERSHRLSNWRGNWSLTHPRPATDIIREAVEFWQQHGHGHVTLMLERYHITQKPDWPSFHIGNRFSLVRLP
jgi:hypothetical protein